MTTSGWQLRRIVEPQIEPVSVEEAKSQCLIDADITKFDTDLRDWIKAARELAEEYTKRSFIEQVWVYSSPAFPADGCSWDDAGIPLPRGPVIRINSVTYLDNDGARQALTDAQYLQVLDDDPPRLFPAYNTFWPTGRAQQGAVQIEYVAGYAAAGSPVDAENVPARAKQAIKLLVGHWLACREAGAPVVLNEIPYGFERSLDSLRIYP